MKLQQLRSAVTCAVFCALTLSTASAQIPDRLRRAAEQARRAGTLLPITTDKEIEIGRGIAATVAGRYPVSGDSALTEYVNLVGLAVAGDAPRPDIAYRFAVLETPDVNAFAAPGGYIFITKGALALIENEAELAGVLAHEVAHVNRKHVIEQIRKADVLGEVKDQSGITGEKLDLVVGQGTSVLFTGLSREDEAASDSLAVVYAANVGYDPGGLAAFVTRLSQRPNSAPMLELLSTHPAPAERAVRIARISQGRPAGATLAERYRSFVPR
ncbi:MAG: M48 family metalloprotease [Gemmatimonadota bacterium]